ncbi:flagellar export chaperone FlgN [Massilia horti]|uniref:Flagellar protein FlgN n=1 Tax=Massilia horti TaxID=2562153 RepID=A0A4Y9ST87_9BURK|nr:flagellar export chaperone FlgN [Massilia horti]TFW29695.1 flagellar protein FlgN [Massilia horti]
MTRMTRGQANAALVDGVRTDLAACAEIRALLERQFEAALRHQSALLTELAAELAPLLDAMEARRQQRVTLVRALFGPEGQMGQFIAALAEPVRGKLAADWQQLEDLVRDCKTATIRNGNLLAEQFSVMQRVLHGEEETYAPR